MHKTLDRITDDIVVNGTSEVTILSGIVLCGGGPSFDYFRFSAAGHTTRTSSTSSSLTFRIRCLENSTSTVISSLGVTSTSTAGGISFTMDGWGCAKPDSNNCLTGGLSVHTGLTTGVAGDGLIQKFANAPAFSTIGPTDGGPRNFTLSLTVQPSNSNFQATFRGGVFEQILDEA